MTVSGGQAVAGALNDVVVDLGRPTAFDPAHLRPAITEALASALTESVAQDRAELAAGQSAGFSTLVDALVIAAEEGVPDGMLDDIPAIDLGDRLEARRMPVELIGWVLHTWGRAVRLAEPSPTTQVPIPDVPASYWAETGSNEAGFDETVPDETVSDETVPDGTYPLVFAPDQPAGFGAGHLARDHPDPSADLPAEYPIDFRTRRSTRGRGPLIALAVVLVLAVAGIGARLALGSGSAVQDKESTRAAAQAKSTPPPAPKVPAVLAYRGGTESFPPDTLPAMLDAAGVGAGVEIDLRWTSDGVPVVMRNARVQPPMYCAQRYAVAATPWKVLASCLTQASVSGDGRSYGIARLDSTLRALADLKSAQAYLEIKVDQTDEQDRKLLSVLNSTRMTGRTVVGSLLPAELAQLRTAATTDGSTVRLMQFVRDRELTPAAAKSAGLWAVAVRQSALEATYVGRLRAAGLTVLAWTPNNPKQWAAARKAGVDQVETGRPRAYAKWAATR